MVVFVDLDEAGYEPPHLHGGKIMWPEPPLHPAAAVAADMSRALGGSGPVEGAEMEAHEPTVLEFSKRNPMMEALGCYPVAVAIASSIDLNTLDNLSRACRQVREALLQYRKVLLNSTLHCHNEHLPVDREETLRNRAMAGNWFNMEDTGRSNYSGKSGCCARDLVAECRRCKAVICRNCTIKPPAPVVVKERHRRLCLACAKAPLGCLVRPRLPPDEQVNSEMMQRAICRCDADGVWLCQPCGKSIRGDDYDYRGIWRWRLQYGEVIGGVGTGIGEGDRGVICGRESECVAAREREQETDCDAADAREADEFLSTLGSTPTPSSQPASASAVTAPLPVAQQSWNPWTAVASHSSSSTSLASTASSVDSLYSHASLASSSLSLGGGLATPPHAAAGQQLTTAGETIASRRTPSPGMLGPGYARHEIEGIGGVVKTKLLQMVKVGACVPEWEDETASGKILWREVSGRSRSWCGWCWRVIPGRKDIEQAHKQAEARAIDR